VCLYRLKKLKKAEKVILYLQGGLITGPQRKKEKNKKRMSENGKRNDALMVLGGFLFSFVGALVFCWGCFLPQRAQRATERRF